MSDTTTESAATDAAATEIDQTDTSDAAGAEKDWQAEAEKWKKFARKHEDEVKTLRPAAARLAEIEESQKSEQQRLADRASAAEAKVAEIEARAMRAEVAAAKGIPVVLLSGTTQEELEASADALLAFRGEKPRPDFGGGQRGADATAKGAMLTKSDIQKLYAERNYDAIEQARQDGRIAMGPQQ